MAGLRAHVLTLLRVQVQMDLSPVFTNWVSQQTVVWQELAAAAAAGAEEDTEGSGGDDGDEGDGCLEGVEGGREARVMLLLGSLREGCAPTQLGRCPSHAQPLLPTPGLSWLVSRRQASRRCLRHM